MAKSKSKKSKKDDSVDLKVGDKIIRFGQVYHVFKIKKEERDGEQKRIAMFRPYFKNKKNRSLVLSIPVQNLEKTSMRKPLNKKAVRKILKNMSELPEVTKHIKTVVARDQLMLNDPYKNVEILKRIWIEKQKKGKNLTKSKQSLLALAIKRLMQEFALATDMTVKKAKEKIKKELEKIPVKKPKKKKK